MSAFPRISTTSIGQNKNAPRVWIEGRYLLKAGFVPAKTIQVEFANQEIRIIVAQDGPRRVSSKKNGEIPVLDLNSSAISDSFGEIQLLQVRITEGEIVLTPAYSEQLRATRCRNGKEGSVYSGGGLLTEAARLAGYQPAFAIEINSDYAAVFEENHTHARMFNLSVEDVPVDELPPVELLTLGIPC
jgi:DNA (cytosine-5)-methyltransferase 1